MGPSDLGSKMHVVAKRKENAEVYGFKKASRQSNKKDFQCL